MKFRNWTQENINFAESEGWRIVSLMPEESISEMEGWGVPRETKPFIESIGTNRMFDDNEDALIYVRNMAEEGRELYVRAMEIIGQPLPFANFETFMEKAASTIEPPIGLMPKAIWLKLRLKDIKEAAKRYESVGKEIPKEWIEEAGELALKLEDWE